MSAAVLTGSRLEYVVVPLDGTVKRLKRMLTSEKIGEGKNEKTIWTRVEKLVEEPAGFMIFFPRGHAMRLKDRQALRKYKLKPGKAKIVNLQGLHDPNSTIGKLFNAQDSERALAMKELEQQVIRLVTHKVGSQILTRTESVSDYDKDDLSEYEFPADRAETPFNMEAV